MKPIETYLNKDGWESIAGELSSQAVEMFVDEYGQEPSPENQSLVEEIAVILALVSLYGWTGAKLDKYSQEAKDIVIDSFVGSNTALAENGQVITDKLSEKEKLLILEEYKGVDASKAGSGQDKATLVFEGLALSIFHTTLKTLAIKEFGAGYVGVITQNDNRVRPTHKPNHLKYWLINTRPDFSGDFRCRCYYFYGTKADMEKKRFSAYS